MTSASARDLLALRHAAQLLSSPLQGGAGAVTAVARRLLAAQGQDPIAVRWALGLRAGVREGDVRDAYASGTIVRSWPMRGTVHVVAAEDLGWLQALTNPSVLAAAPRRRQSLGLELEQLERMREIAIDALADGALSRTDLIARFEQHGIAMGQGWAYHSIWFLSQTGTIVGGPPAGGRENLYVLADQWIREPVRLAGDEALAELAARYLAGHGPAQPADLAWWAGLGVTAVKRGLAIAEADGRAQRLTDEDGTAWWAAADADPAVVPELPDVQLLPAFDELLLGFKDRSASVDAAHRSRVMSTNGIASPTLMREGRVAGVWSRKANAIEVTPFEGVPPVDERALDRELDRLRVFWD